MKAPSAPTLIGVLVIALAACSSPSTGGSPTGSSAASVAVGGTITIANRSYGVAEITVPAGPVLFVNSDSVAHTVTEGENGTKAANARIDEEIAPGSSKVINFSDAGDYKITCRFHPTMNLTVHVQ